MHLHCVPNIPLGSLEKADAHFFFFFCKPSPVFFLNEMQNNVCKFISIIFVCFICILHCLTGSTSFFFFHLNLVNFTVSEMYFYTSEKLFTALSDEKLICCSRRNNQAQSSKEKPSQLTARRMRKRNMRFVLPLCLCWLHNRLQV